MKERGGCLCLVFCTMGAMGFYKVFILAARVSARRQWVGRVKRRKTPEFQICPFCFFGFVSSLSGSDFVFDTLA